MVRYIKGREHITHALADACKRLFEGRSPVLLHTLRERYPSLRKAYVLRHIPDDSAEFFSILITPQEVVQIELGRDPQEVRSFEVQQVSEWIRTLSPSRKRAVFIAQELLARQE